MPCRPLGQERIVRSRKAAVATPPLRRGRVDRGRSGHFYYPLQTPQGATGSVVSVSAPFKLDADRTKVLDSDWNQWLAGAAAELAADLLSSDWLQRFGADAYLALAQAWPSAPAHFATRTAAHLKDAACWPTHERTLVKASAIVVPGDPMLSGLLGANRYLDSRLAERQEAIDLALRNGAKRFTLNSLVRLRCAGGDSSKLATRPGEHEANYHFSDYAAQLADEDEQRKMAARSRGSTGACPTRTAKT